MATADLLVAAAALGGIVCVNWYFFFSERKAGEAMTGAGGVQEATVRVKGGYEPAVVRVRAGSPVRLTFERQETSGCSEEVVFPEFGLKRFLPAHRSTTVELLPEKAGEFGFTCGMGMLQGRLVVTEAEV